MLEAKGEPGSGRSYSDGQLEMVILCMSKRGFHGNLLDPTLDFRGFHGIFRGIFHGIHTNLKKGAALEPK